MEEQRITVRVKRYRPGGAGGPFYQEYQVPYRGDTVVLDALNHIKDNMDGTLTYRWSCRMGICGSCGATVNGTPKLTCETFLKDYRGVVTVEPLANFPVMKDLVVDISDFMGKLQSVKPWIIRPGINDTSQGEYRQTPLEMDLYQQQSLCINCMICYAACPVYGHDPRFLGPAAAALAYRYVMDSRDRGRSERLRAAMAHDGVYECTFVGECSHVCPKDVDPAGAIQRLKAQGAFSLLMPRGGR